MGNVGSYLYIAASPNFPGEVKIGISNKDRPQERIANSKNDPTFRKDSDVRILGFFMMKNARAGEVEAATHKILQKCKSDSIYNEKEWFTVNPSLALSVIEFAARNHTNKRKILSAFEAIDNGEEIDKFLILDDLAPDFLKSKFARSLSEPEWSPEKRDFAASRFSKLYGSSYETPIGWRGQMFRQDVVFVPIEDPPDDYFWHFAEALIPQRAKLMGEDVAEIYRVIPSGFLKNLDVSVPEHQPFLRNGVVPGTINREGTIDLDFSLNEGAHGIVDRSTDVLYETDLVNSHLMGRITNLYWELREQLDEVLPPVEEPRRICDRTWYLHTISSFCVASRPEDLTPRYAQYLHSAAMNRAGTPPDMAICPVELCEIVGPILERSGRTVEMSAPSEDPEVG